MRGSKCRTGAPQRGMSLIEVLVSMVILSLGVLAVVALQLVSKRNNADAGQRTVAAQLAYDMIERMRANSFEVALDDYQTASGNPIGVVGGYLAAPSGATCDGSGATCTSTQLAAYDLYEWEQALLGAAEQISGSSSGGLVFPTACIALTTPISGGDGVYTVTIAWRGSIELPDNSDVPCGSAATDASSNRLYGASDEFRRTVSISIFITARRQTT